MSLTACTFYDIISSTNEIDFIKGVPYENKNSLIITDMVTPRYYDEVK